MFKPGSSNLTVVLKICRLIEMVQTYICHYCQKVFNNKYSDVVPMVINRNFSDKALRGIAGYY